MKKGKIKTKEKEGKKGTKSDAHKNVMRLFLEQEVELINKILQFEYSLISR